MSLVPLCREQLDWYVYVDTKYPWHHWALHPWTNCCDVPGDADMNKLKFFLKKEENNKLRYLTSWPVAKA
jgi:hypothetical protein